MRVTAFLCISLIEYPFNELISFLCTLPLPLSQKLNHITFYESTGKMHTGQEFSIYGIKIKIKNKKLEES